MSMFPREYRGIAFAVALFLLVQLGALALITTFAEQGYQAVENPDDPTNSLIYIGAILIATVGFLAAFKYNLDWIVRVVIVGVSGVLAWYVFAALLPASVAAGFGAAVAVTLWVYPEWYVVNTAGVLMGAGAAGLFGITFGLLPALVLLVVLAVYDAISVYKTKHMLDLADGVMDLRIPAILIIPLTLSYSLLDDDFGAPAADETAAESDTDSADSEVVADGDGDSAADADSATDEAAADNTASDADPPADDADPASDETEDDRRDVFFIGLGDAVIPGVLVASAAFFSTAPQYAVPIIQVNTPALFAMIGTVAGLLVLLRMVMNGRAHAGLPLLNGGAIGGYLLGAWWVGIPLAEAVGVAGLL